MRRAGQFGLLIGLGAIAVLVIWSLLDQRPSPGVITETEPLATRESGVAQSIANAAPLEPASRSTTEDGALVTPPAITRTASPPRSTASSMRIE
jgi:hypothetical protein